MTGAEIDVIATAVEQRDAVVAGLEPRFEAVDQRMSTAWPARCGAASCAA